MWTTGRSVDVPDIRAALPDAQVSNYTGRRLVILNESGEIESGKLVPNSEVRARCVTTLR
jgi:hypothetical protein